MQEKWVCDGNSIGEPTVYLHNKKGDAQACSKEQELYLSKGIVSILG